MPSIIFKNSDSSNEVWVVYQADGGPDGFRVLFGAPRATQNHIPGEPITFWWRIDGKNVIPNTDAKYNPHKVVIKEVDATITLPSEKYPPQTTND